MRKVSKKHLEIFTAECRRLIDECELNNWRVSIVIDDEIGGFGQCLADVSGYVATISLCANWNDRTRPLTTKTLQETALHEVNHLMIARLECQAKSRFITGAELGEASEELVRKLSFVMRNI